LCFCFCSYLFDIGKRSFHACLEHREWVSDTIPSLITPPQIRFIIYIRIILALGEIWKAFGLRRHCHQAEL